MYLSVCMFPTTQYNNIKVRHGAENKEIIFARSSQFYLIKSNYT